MVVNAYTLTFAGFMLLGGRAADLFGRKRMFLLGLGLFTAASLAGGLAQQSWQLLGARAVQGVGAAVLGIGLLATPLASIATTGVPADDAGIASGVINTCRTMGGALGLAILATLAAAHTAGSRGPQPLASGYALAFQIGAAVLVFCALLMLAMLRGERETPRGPSPHST